MTSDPDRCGARAASSISPARSRDETSAVPTWLILVSLKAQRHGAQRELAEAVGVEGPTLTHHLNRMETAGLVTRTRDPQNRRVHQVELTEAGDAAFQHLLGTVRSFDARLRTGFTADELTSLGEMLGRLRRNLGDPMAQGSS